MHHKIASEINLEALILVRFSCTGLKLITPACQFSCYGDFDIFPQWNNLQFNWICLMICCIGLSIWLSFLNHHCQKVFSVNDLWDPFKTWKKWANSAVTSQKHPQKQPIVKTLPPKKEKRSNLMLHLHDPLGLLWHLTISPDGIILSVY